MKAEGRPFSDDLPRRVVHNQFPLPLRTFFFFISFLSVCSTDFFALALSTSSDYQLSLEQKRDRIANRLSAHLGRAPSHTIQP